MKRRKLSKRSAVIAIIIGVVTLAVVFALVALAVTPVKYEVSEGQAATATITASRDITDTISTQAAILAARDSVSPMFSVDDTVSTRVKGEISAYFDDLAQAAEYIKEKYIDEEVKNNSYYVSRESLEQSYDPSSVDWEAFLDDTQLSEIRDMMGSEDISNEIVYALAALDEAALLIVKEDVKDIVEVSLDNGIQSEHVQTEIDGVRREIEALYVGGYTADLALIPVDKYLDANMMFDEDATEQARLIIEQEVSDVVYKQSQTVVVEGDIVSAAQMKVLQDLGVVGGEDADFKLYVGMLVFVLLLFGVYGAYMYQFESETLADTRKLLIIATVVVIVVGISVPLARLDYRILPVFLGAMLVSVLVSRKSALALGVLLAFLAGAISSWNSGILSAMMLRTVMMAIIGGSVSVFALYRPGRRTSLIFAGLVAGLVSVLIALLISMVGSTQIVVSNLWLDFAYALGSGLLAGVLAIGTLPLWEAIFRVSTPTKLLELSNPNHPLLKRLTIEAPGTYHHSILTANLAEAGADAIGANALLCRVGAYYHDVGKLEGPKYFKENQKGENPHDGMNPIVSAKIITDHLTDGLDYAQKYKLPRDVQKVIAQHHGDTTVAYFLHKAREAGEEVDEAAYRYGGSKPSTKEAAVVMLADTVEAAVRSMDDPSKDEVKDMINQLIRARYNDGQLDECPLNRRDLNTIAKAFLTTFDGALHERVKYPGQE
ncbi:MAG: HDIG domain-containing protein [Clostridia bacterium]|nr:HDIG domain-containing protein [Clostridia bacterium]